MARHPILTDDEILARARSLFIDRGYGARTKQIASAVGLTWGAIALRFGDKRTLFTRAMAGAVCSPGDLVCEQAGRDDLPGLLGQLRSRLWERWPRRLQFCLATTTAGQDDEPDRLLDWLATTLEAQASRGSLRSDMNSRDLAQVVVALLVGDVAQRFVAHERILMDDPTFIDSVVRLLTAN